MRRGQLVVERWIELERHQSLRYWKPGAGCRKHLSIGYYSRLQAIGILEDALTRRRGKGLDLVCNDTLADSLETELMEFYSDLDGIFDHFPLLFSSAPNIVQNLMPEMLVEHLKQWDANSPIMLTGLRDSIIQDYLCELTGLQPTQLVIGKASGCLVIPDQAADTEHVRVFDLPGWLAEVNDLVCLGWREHGLMMVSELRAHLIREVKNSTSDIGNCLYR